MTKTAAGLRDYAELFRVSNLPTVVSNVLVGAAIGVDPRGDAAGIPWSAAAVVAAAMAMFYAAGMALNDAFDARIDARERPQRPIPSGRVSRRTAFACAAAGLLLGFAMIAAFASAAWPYAAALAASIVAYDWLHARTPLSVVLMGACRGLVYLTAAAACAAAISGADVAAPAASTVGSSPDSGLSAASASHRAWRGFVPVIGITAYTILVSLVARSEASAAASPLRLAAVLTPVAVLPAAVVLPLHATLWAVPAAAAVFIWLCHAVACLHAPQPRIQTCVLRLLSGMCLVDAFFLTLLGRPAVAGIVVACFVVTCRAHDRIRAT